MLRQRCCPGRRFQVRQYVNIACLLDGLSIHLSGFRTRLHPAPMLTHPLLVGNFLQFGLYSAALFWMSCLQRQYPSCNFPVDMHWFVFHQALDSAYKTAVQVIGAIAGYSSCCLSYLSQRSGSV